MMIYVAHKGDDVVAIGTIDEVAKKLGIKERTVKYLSCNAHHKRWAEKPNTNSLVTDRVVISE